MLVWVIIIMLTLLLLGYPMKVPLLGGALFIFVCYFPNLNKIILAQQTINGVKPISLVAVPMFIFAADIITYGESANKLLDFIRSVIGHIRGGFAITTCASCTAFGAISGSTQATVCAIGGALRPKLLESGYSSPFANALIINASDLAFLIPPSIGMIIYGVASKTSVGELFIAGIGPGVMIFLLFSVFCYVHAVVTGIPTAPKFSWKDRLIFGRRALFTFAYPIIVVGGIYAGFFSPTEAAAVSVLYAVILEVVIYRSISLKTIPSIALSTGVVTGVVFILIGAGMAFSWAIAYAKIPALVLPQILGTDPGTVRILLTISLAYFIGCMFVDPIVVVMILTPVFTPVVNQAGIDPVLVGTIVTLQCAIGSATPPFGCDIFTAIAIFRRPYFEVIRATPPFIVILVLSSLALIWFPDIALFLRDLAFNK